jgi:HEAT repeat protein
MRIHSGKSLFTATIAVVSLFVFLSRSLGSEPIVGSESTVATLTKQLKEGRPNEQIRAVQLLGELGPRAADAVPQLAALAKVDDLALRLETVVALGRISSDFKTSRTVLIPATSDEAPIIQYSAVEALRMFGPDAHAALPELRKLLASENRFVRVAAARAITSIAVEDSELIDAVIPVLIDGLTEGPHVAFEAQQGLIASGVASVPALQTLLTEKDLNLRIHALDALAGIGPEAGEATEAVVVSLSNENREVVLHGLRALGAIGAKPEAVIPELKKGLQFKEPVMREQSAKSLGEYGPAAAPAVESLVAALRDEQDSVRIAAALALGKIGPDARSATPALVAALEDPMGSVTVAAALTLGQMGKSAIPALIEKLKDPRFQQLAIRILSEMGPEAVDALPELTRLLRSKDTALSREAILAVSAMGPAARQAVPELIARLNDKSYADRSAAAFALGNLQAREAASALKAAAQTPKDLMLRLVSFWALMKVDPGNSEMATLAIPQLTEALQDEQPRLRRAAIHMLGKMGNRSKAALPAIRKCLRDEVLPVRIEAITALAEIGIDTEETLPDLIRLLGDDQPETIRQSAAYAIGKAGPLARGAVPALRRMATSRNPLEKTVSAWALVQVAPDVENVKLAIPLLIHELERTSRPDVRLAMARALANAGAASSEGAEALSAGLKSADRSAQEAVEKASRELQPAAKVESTER